jgi:hypothetical protein
VSSASNIFVATDAASERVAEVVSHAVGRELVGDEWIATRSGWPRVEVGPNRLAAPHVEDGFDLTAYPYLVRVEGDGRSELARTIFEAVKAAGYGALLEGDEGFLDQHDPGQQKAAAG